MKKVERNCFIFLNNIMKQEELQKIFDANKNLDEKFLSINKDKKYHKL
jgi:hypothetical protein